MRREAACQDAHEAAIFGAAPSIGGPSALGAHASDAKWVPRKGVTLREQKEEEEEEEDDPLEGAVVVPNPWVDGGDEGGRLASDAPVVVPAAEAAIGTKAAPGAAPLVSAEVSELGTGRSLFRSHALCVAVCIPSCCWLLGKGCQGSGAWNSDVCIVLCPLHGVVL